MIKLVGFIIAISGNQGENLQPYSNFANSPRIVYQSLDLCKADAELINSATRNGNDIDSINYRTLIGCFPIYETK